MSKASALSTFNEQYPLNPDLTKWEWTAPTANTVGILALSFEIFLSDKIRAVLPSLTAVSHSSLIASILFFNENFISKVQSIILIFFAKTLLNFLNWELVKIGLSKT